MEEYTEADVISWMDELRAQHPDPRPCPLHSECELYLKKSECPYRSGELTYEEAENQASDQAGFR